MRIKPEVLDELLKDYKKPEDVIGENGRLKQLTKALLERALNAELTHHLGYEKHERVAEKGDNAWNGASEKTLETEQGEMVVQIPRDRNATFEPQIVRKHQRRFAGFDDKIISMYARGMSTREIQGRLEKMYGVEVTPALISEVTDIVSGRSVRVVVEELKGCIREVLPCKWHIAEVGGMQSVERLVERLS